MSKEHDTAEAGVKPVGFLISKKEQKKQQGRANTMGQITRYIPKTLSNMREATTFSEAQIAEMTEGKRKNCKIEFVGQRYTNSAMHTLYSLAYVISMERQEKDIVEFVEATKGENIRQSQYVTRTIPIKEFCQMMYQDKRAKNIAIIIRDIMQLASIPIAWPYMANGELRIKTAPILYYEFDYPYEAVNEKAKKKYKADTTAEEITIAINKFLSGTSKLTEKEKDLASYVIAAIKDENRIQVTFGRPFFQDLNNAFAYVPYELITDWGKDGTGTRNDVFPVILNELLYLQRQYVYFAKQAESAATTEARRDKLTTEQREALVSEKVERTLTGELLFSTIDRELDGMFFKERRYKLLQNLISSSMEFLRKKALIRKYYFTGKGKDLKVHFVFNPDYGSKYAISTLKEIEEAQPQQDNIKGEG